MQKILNVKTEDTGNRNSIPLMGKMLCLVKVTKVSVPEGEGSLVVHTFDDGSVPTCYAFGWYHEPGVDENSADSKVELVCDLDEFGHMFRMTDEDTTILSNFAIDTAAQLGLLIVPMDGGVVVTSARINKLAEDGVPASDLSQLASSDRNYATALSPAGAATLLGEIVKTGIRRYNKVNLDDKVGEVAEIIKKCRYINDEGDSKPISLTGVENLLKRVKDLLFVSPEE